MKIHQIKIVFVASVLFCCFLTAGCGKSEQSKILKASAANTNSTIASLGEVFSQGAIRVEGYGVVGNLNGAGSGECPTQIRSYLQQYILKQSPKLNVEKFLSSSDTAVVSVEGVIPAGAFKGQYFDLRIRALEGTGTISLRGGWLYSAVLKAAERFNTSIKVLAMAEGSVYIDFLTEQNPDQREGYVLAGGRVLDEFDIAISLRQPDYRIAGFIRDHLNGRFGSYTVKNISPSQVVVKVPAKYIRRKQNFESLLKAIYVVQSDQAVESRIIQLVGQLASSENKQESEIALEAMGRLSLSKLTALLSSHNEEVRFRAARCMLNLESDKGLEVLRQMALNKASLYRIEAIEAIRYSGRREDGAVISRQLLRDEDFDIRVAAYKNLLALDDVTIISSPIGRKFHLDQITQPEFKAIYVTRSGHPRIVLFGAPLYCRDSIFIESSDGQIIINASSSQKHVSIMRKYPKRPNIGPIQLQSSFKVSDIIRTLGKEPVGRDRPGQPGLNVSYAEIIALLKQMCQKGAVEAEFREGPLPEIGF